MTNDPIRLVQLFHPEYKRRIALVREPSLILLKNIYSIYDLAFAAIHAKKNVEILVSSDLSDEILDYNSVYDGRSDPIAIGWKLLPSFDHPGNPFGCLVSGTGLTHKNSALNRQMMHLSGEDKLNDSMKMYQWGVDGGSPGNGKIGVQPEWFYKGNGSSLRAHGETLEVPSYANDGGEEPEIAGIYVIDEEGQPWRIGFTTANEFSDHVMEKKNYLYLAPSKLRQCAIGPELVINGNFGSIDGGVSILRKEQTIWSAKIKSGEKNMAHSLENLEYHHFKYAGHRIPLQAHVHFFGADAFSFGNARLPDGQEITLQDGDLMQIEWDGMGRALENPTKISTEGEKLITIKSLS